MRENIGGDSKKHNFSFVLRCLVTSIVIAGIITIGLVVFANCLMDAPKFKAQGIPEKHISYIEPLKKDGQTAVGKHLIPERDETRKVCVLKKYEKIDGLLKYKIVAAY